MVADQDSIASGLVFFSVCLPLSFLNARHDNSNQHFYGLIWCVGWFCLLRARCCYGILHEILDDLDDFVGHVGMHILRAEVLAGECVFMGVAGVLVLKHGQACLGDGREDNLVFSAPQEIDFGLRGLLVPQSVGISRDFSNRIHKSLHGRDLSDLLSAMQARIDGDRPALRNA